MSKFDIDFSFRKDISQIKRVTHSSISSPKDYSSCGLSSFNSTSRFQQKKVLRKLREQDVLNRISQKLKKFQQNDQLLKETMRFRPIRNRKSKREKQNE